MNSKHQSLAPAQKQMEAESQGTAAEAPKPVVQPVLAVNVVTPVAGVKTDGVDLDARNAELREEDRVRAPNPSTNRPVAA